MLFAIQIIFYVFILVNFACCQTKAANKTPPKIEFRLVDTNNYSPNNFRFPVRGSNESIAVKPEIAATEADIISVKLHTEKFWVMFRQYKYYEIQINFSNQGAQRLNDAIKSNIGEILAVIIDGEVVRQLVIKRSIQKNTFVLEGNMTRAEAVELVQMFQD